MTIPSHIQRISLLALIPLLIIIPLLVPRAAAVTQDVTWQPSQIRSVSPGLTNVYPDVAYDAAGKIHMVWLEYGPLDTDASRVLYTNNVAGTWLAPYVVSVNGGRHANHVIAIAVETNRVHVMYMESSWAMVHRYLTMNGATPTPSATTKLTTGGSSSKGYNPDMVVDTAGRVHAFYITNKSGGAYKVFHRIWEAGAFQAGERIVRDGEPLQTYPKVAATADGRVHVIWNSNNTKVKYSAFNGTNWVPGADVAVANIKQVGLTASGNTVMALYTTQSPTPAFHDLYFTQQSTGAWSPAVRLSSGASYDEFPEIFTSPSTGKAYALWSSGPDSTNTSITSREITPGTGASSPIRPVGGVKATNPRGAGSPVSAEISAVWQDKAASSFAVRHAIGTVTTAGTPVPTTPVATVPPTLTPTPLPPTATPIPPVTFTATRTSPSPSNNLQIAVSLNGIQGNPTQIRYSLTPFTANDPLPAWNTYTPTLPGFTVNAPAALGLTCGVATVYIQMRNPLAQSVVQTISAVIDTTVQTSGYIRNPNLEGNRLPGETLANLQNIYGPKAGEDDYTREPRYYYRFSQEPAICAGIKEYRDQDSLETVPSVWPYNFFAAKSFASNLNTGPDPGGVGYPEQAFMATVVITDKLNNPLTLSRRMIFDDDPPVLVLTQTAALTFAGVVSPTNQAIVSLVFTATVTDDGYQPRTPVGKNYWGVWVLAVDPTVTTNPTPSQFLQYGQPIRLDPGTSTIRGVKLSNGLATGAGQRRVYVAFLDGAGNFSGFTGIDTFNGGLLSTSTIRLQDPLVLPPYYLPLIMK